MRRSIHRSVLHLSGFLCSLILCFSLLDSVILDFLILDSRSLDTTPYTTHPRIGLALSGGGIRGLVHLGVLRTSRKPGCPSISSRHEHGGLAAAPTVPASCSMDITPSRRRPRSSMSLHLTASRHAIFDQCKMMPMLPGSPGRGDDHVRGPASPSP